MKKGFGKKYIEYGAYQARTHFSYLLDKVERGEIINITRRNRLVAVLCRPDRLRSMESKEAIQAFNRLRKQHPVKATAEEMQNWKQDGRM